VAVRDAATEVLETVADLLMHAAREVDMARDAGYRRRYELVSLHLQTALSPRREGENRDIEGHRGGQEALRRVGGGEGLGWEVGAGRRGARRRRQVRG
jgi:hypothetical protein